MDQCSRIIENVCEVGYMKRVALVVNIASWVGRWPGYGGKGAVLVKELRAGSVRGVLLYAGKKVFESSSVEARADSSFFCV